MGGLWVVRGRTEPMACSGWIAYLDGRAGTFLEAFWPNFVATAVSVVLGIPVALWLYSHGARKAQAQARRDDQARLTETVQVLVEVLHEHVEQLGNAAKRDDTAFETVTELRTAVWDAVREDAFRLIPGAELRGRLASHFERVERLNAAHAMRTQRILARQGQAVWGAGSSAAIAALEASIHETMRSEAAEAASTAAALLSTLEAILRQARTRAG